MRLWELFLPQTEGQRKNVLKLWQEGPDFSLFSVPSLHFFCRHVLGILGGRLSETCRLLPLPISRTHSRGILRATAHAGVSFVARESRASEFERKRRNLRGQGERGAVTETKTTTES